MRRPFWLSPTALSERCRDLGALDAELREIRPLLSQLRKERRQLKRRVKQLDIRAREQLSKASTDAWQTPC